MVREVLALTAAILGLYSVVRSNLPHSDNLVDATWRLSRVGVVFYSLYKSSWCWTTGMLGYYDAQWEKVILLRISVFAK